MASEDFRKIVTRHLVDNAEMLPSFQALELRKVFRPWRVQKPVIALDGISLTVRPGTIFGLLGPNGAGKTTLVKIALTIARPDSGEVRLFGEPLAHRHILRRVGYLPENPRFPNHLTARQVLRLYGNLSGATPASIEKNGAAWLERVGLGARADSRVSKFSKGMNERLALAQALVHDPDLIFLDEPTDGLDPMGRLEVRNICRELAQSGRTIFINSHILAEIELICDEIALMKNGRIIEQGTVAQLTHADEGYEVVVPAVDSIAGWLKDKALNVQSLDGHVHIRVADRASANALIDALRGKNIEIESLAVKRQTLESVFMERVSGKSSGSRESGPS